MTRWAAFLVALSVSVAAIAQTPMASKEKIRPLPQDGQKSKLRVNLGDNVSFNYELTFAAAGDTVVEVGRCELVCEGKKHPKHDQCDKTCDKPCLARTLFDGKHHFDLQPTKVDLAESGDGPPPRPHGQSINQAYTQFGLPGQWNGSTLLDNVDHSFRPSQVTPDGESWKWRVALDHWNDTPCSSSIKVVDAKVFIVTVNWKLIEERLRPDGNVTINQGPTGTFRYKLTFPVPQEPRVAGTSVSCRCETTQTGTEHGMIPGYPFSEGEYAYIEQGGVKAPLTGDVIKTHIGSIVVHDMTKATIYVNGTSPGTLYIPAGWELDCVDGRGQDVQLCSDLKVDALGFPYTMQVSLSPQPETYPLRVACLEIGKPEPAEGMKYQFVPPRSIGIARLAHMTRASRFRGPWDQMRLWIATDAAPYEKISKTLIPSPGPGTYVRELFKAARVGAISTADPAIQKLMETKFLFSELVDRESLAWFAERRAGFDPKGLVRDTKGSKGAIADLFSTGDVNDDRIAIEAVVSGLAQNGEPSAIEAATWILSQGVPEAHRALTNQSSGANQLALTLMTTSDPAAAAYLLDWFEKCKPSGMNVALANSNANLPDAVKKRIAQTLRDYPAPRQIGEDLR